MSDLIGIQNAFLFCSLLALASVIIFELIFTIKMKITQGMLATIKFPFLSRPLLCTVSDFKQGIICLILPETTKNYSLTPESPITCRISETEFECVIVGSVGEISGEAATQMSIRIESIKKHINTRKNIRYNVTIPSNIIVPQTDSSLSGVISNISMSGALVAVNNKDHVELKVGTDVVISAPLEGNTLLNFEACVMRVLKTDQNISYGLLITSANDTTTELINKVISDTTSQLTTSAWGLSNL